MDNNLLLKNIIYASTRLSGNISDRKWEISHLILQNRNNGKIS